MANQVESSAPTCTEPVTELRQPPASPGRAASWVPSRPLQLIKHAFSGWRSSRLRQAYQDAQLALGQRMAAAGIDDGTLGPQIAALDNELRQVNGDRARVQTLEARRVALMLELARLALRDDAPLPGADIEYQRARVAEAALA